MGEFHHESHGGKKTPETEAMEFISSMLLLTIFFTTPTLGGLVKCWLTCLGLTKEEGIE
jgi:hypothetical protein